MSNEVQSLADSGIAAPSAILDPIALAKHLRGTSAFGSNEGGVEEVRIRRVLRQHAGKRCTLEVAVRIGNRWQSFIAKIYRRDRSDVFDAMRGIQQAGFGSQEEFSIPQPFAYDSSLKCLVQEKVEGQVAKEVFQHGDEGSHAAAAKRCALWLARFHTLAPKTGPVSHPADFVDFKSVQRRLDKITKLDGRAGDKAVRLFHRLEAAATSLKRVTLSAGHGSFSAAHVLFAQERTVAFDWDGFDLADPARDVARFLAHLPGSHLGRPGSLRALDGTAAIFMNTYLSAARTEVEGNFHFFEAAICLNSALRNLRRGARQPEKLSKAEAKLEQGFAALDEANAG